MKCRQVSDLAPAMAQLSRSADASPFLFGPQARQFILYRNRFCHSAI